MKYSAEYWNERVTQVTELLKEEFPDEEFSEEKTRAKFKEFIVQYKE